MRRLIPALVILVPLPAWGAAPFPDQCKFRQDFLAMERLSADLQEIWGPEDGEASYGELAKARLVPLYATLRGRLAGFHPEALPHQHEEVAEVRKVLLALRRNVDFFAYAYPQPQISALRGELDDGYAALGRFKELSDAQLDSSTRVYHPEALFHRRQAVLAWRDAFLREDHLGATVLLLEHPLDRPDSDRSKKELGRFAWGGVKKAPGKNQTALESARRLVRASLKAALREYPLCLALPDPLSTERRERLHDFKKRIRSLYYLLSDFRELSSASSAVDGGRLFLFETEEAYGAIIDELTALDHANSTGDLQRAESLEARVTADWQELRRWQLEVGLDQRLSELRELLRAPDPRAPGSGDG